MYTKYCFINVATLLFVCFTQFQSPISASHTDTSEPTIELSSSNSIISVSIAETSPAFTVITGPNTISTATTGSITSMTGTESATASHTNNEPTITSMTGTESATASHTNNEPTITSMTGTESATASHTHTGSAITSMTDTETNTAFITNTGTETVAGSVAVSGATTEMMNFTANTTTSATTTAPIIITNITLIYQYRFRSNNTLFTGTTSNSAVLFNVKNLVKQSFNGTNYQIKVLQVNIQQQAKDFQNYILSAVIQFTGNNCNAACIQNTEQTPNIVISLPTTAGTFVDVTFQTKPDLVPPMPSSTVIYPIGGPSPGLPGQLGMGLGISLFVVVLIGTAIFLYWKYGLSDSPRTNEYAMTRY